MQLFKALLTVFFLLREEFCTCWFAGESLNSHHFAHFFCFAQSAPDIRDKIRAAKDPIPFLWFYQDVVMVIHKTKSMVQPIVFFNNIADYLQEYLPVRIIHEKTFPCVPSGSYMIYRSRRFYFQWAYRCRPRNNRLFPFTFYLLTIRYDYGQYLCDSGSGRFSAYQNCRARLCDDRGKLEPEGIGTILSEYFITSIVKSGRFEVVERAMLQKIIAEQNLSTTGLVDESTASQLGKLLGVDVIITGSILNLRNSIDINARILSVQSGSIIAAEDIGADTDKDYHDLVKQLTAKIMQNFP